MYACSNSKLAGIYIRIYSTIFTPKPSMQCAFSLASMDFKTMQNYCSFVEIESTSFLVSMGLSAYSLQKDIYDTEKELFCNDKIS